MNLTSRAGPTLENDWHRAQARGGAIGTWGGWEWAGRSLHSRLVALALVAVLPCGIATAASVSEPPAAAPAAVPPVAASLSEVVVYLKEGQRITGLLVSTDTKQIVVRVAGINTRLPIESVERYEVLAPILERYEELRKSIGNDPDDLVRLAQWLQAREQYPLALSEINRAMELDKDHAEATRLKAILEQLIVLRHRPHEKSPARSAPEAANPARPRPGEFPLLTAADINLIRVYEVDLASKPRVVIPRETAVRMMEAHAGHPLVPLTREGREAVVRRPAGEVLDLMFKVRAREFYKEVEVLDQPAAIRLFRENVQRTWLMSCATTQCHGGLEAGRLALFNHTPNSDPSVYTNLLILERFRTSIGAEAPASIKPNEPVALYGRPLINWDQPERSPLLQIGLPREDSLYPHPKVPRPDGFGGGPSDVWKPEFRSTEDRLFKKAVEWIRAMYRPRPEYPIEYTPVRPFAPPLPTKGDVEDAPKGTKPMENGGVVKDPPAR